MTLYSKTNECPCGSTCQRLMRASYIVHGTKKVGSDRVKIITSYGNHSIFINSKEFHECKVVHFYRCFLTNNNSSYEAYFACFFE